MSAWEIALWGASVTALAVCCVLTSSRKYFWHDEVMSWTLVTDPSFRHTIHAVANGVDGAPPLYHTLGYIWVRVFGTTELALRAFSCLAFASAVALVWITLRRRYTATATAIGVLVSFSMSGLVLYQVAEARFYGLLTALVALAVYLFVRASESECDSAGWLAALFATHLALVYTHVYGLVYSGAILCAWVVADWHRGRWRPRLYGAILLAWLAFVPWLPALQRAAALGRPRGWIRPPRVHDLLVVYGFGIRWLPLAVAVIVLLAAWGGMAPSLGASGAEDDRVAPPEDRVPGRRPTSQPVRAIALIALTGGIAAIGSRLSAPGVGLERAIADPNGVLIVILGVAVGLWAVADRRGAQPTDATTPLVIVALALLAVPFAGFVVSRVVMPILVPRYVLPSIVGVAILLARGSELVADVVGPGATRAVSVAQRTVGRVSTAGMLLGLAVYPIWTSRGMPAAVRPGARLEAVLPPGATVIVGRGLDFLPLLHYQRRADIRYVFPMDSVVYASPQESYGALFIYKYMATLARVGYLSPSDTAPGSALCTHAALYVAPAVVEPWLTMRLTSDRGLAVERVTDPASPSDSALAFVVRRRGAGPRPCIKGVERPHPHLAERAVSDD